MHDIQNSVLYTFWKSSMIDNTWKFHLVLISQVIGLYYCQKTKSAEQWHEMCMNVYLTKGYFLIWNPYLLAQHILLG